MSLLADRRWTLVGWVFSKNMKLEDAVDLVDKLECRSEAIEFAFDNAEEIQMKQDYQDMVSSVTYIWNTLEAKND